MGVSLKKAASQLLKWNIIGQKFARAARGDWIIIEDNGKCTACKIGMVMIGRYGIELAANYYGGEPGSRLERTLNYGPLILCPVSRCKSTDYNDSGLIAGSFGPKYPLGSIIEHLFEHHKWSVMKIDRWLAELSEAKVSV